MSTNPAQPASRVLALVFAVVALTSPAALATWSIVLADGATGEVAVGTVTCLNDFDLLAIVPVVVVGRGAAACQASGDFDGIRRPIIFNGLKTATSPSTILTQLSAISGHASRQYGIVDTFFRTVTFTGPSCLAWAGGQTGFVGSMGYAIQGNILTGSCVVPAIVDAVVNTPGDMAEKLMAGMEAADAAGGDGRCSCSGQPTSCGCPPPSFTKAGHIGGLIVARIGDIDDTICNAGGCADGNYFMRLDVSFQANGDPDPVLQLRGLFNQWRTSLLGRPDAIRTSVVMQPAALPPDGASTSTMRITLRDWTGNVVTTPMHGITVQHAPGSGGNATIGPVQSLGNGVYTVQLIAGSNLGVDRFRVRVDDGIRPVTLMPDPQLAYFATGDVNCDTIIDLADVDAFVLALVGEPAYSDALPGCNLALADCNGDGVVDFADIDPFVALLAR